MKGLTLTQPWASLVAFNEKRIETRSWPTGYRGRIAIHAAKGLAEPIRNEDGLSEICLTDPFMSTLVRRGVSTTDQLPRGCVVAAADLVACIRTDRLDWALSHLPELCDFTPAEHEKAFGNYEPGRFAWLLGNIAAFEPIEWRGAQGLWSVPEDVWWSEL